MTENKGLHSKNTHNKKYDFKALIKSFPSLKSFVSENQYNDLSVDFSNPKAVLALNQALLNLDYQVEHWTIPKGHLCPPIPGRADYIHHIADLIADKNIKSSSIKGLDIGTGTGCIYPILGHRIYSWKFVASDVNSDSINHCREILNANPSLGLKKNIKLRFQKSIDHIFRNIIKPDESFDFSMCNPPFHSSILEARQATQTRVRKLNISKVKKGHDKTQLKSGKASSFGGKNHELWYPGGELTFLSKMINESLEFKDQCHWFTTLVSNKKLLINLKQQLQKINCAQTKIIEMNQGSKLVHILVWSFKNTP